VLNAIDVNNSAQISASLCVVTHQIKD
jgi:hypothetical protein